MENINVSIPTLDSQTLLNQIVLEYLREQKRKRRWRMIRGFGLLLLILLVAYWFVASMREDKTARNQAHIGLINLTGNIFDKQTSSADNVVRGLAKAYDNKTLKAIILRINSPGGSPVQANYIFNMIRYYREKYPDVKVYAVCADLCTSAAYYVAVAADEIYADPSSLVGSIGVIYNGFGFVDTLQKLGVSRRLQTAGQNKGFMDQFSPTNPAQEKMLQTMLDIIHQKFINVVTERRGERLHLNKDTFSGLMWTGVQAQELGLIDGLASSGQVARNIIKIDQLVDYTYEPSIIERVSRHIGTALADQLPVALGIKPGIQ